jgi:hypothetical protein
LNKTVGKSDLVSTVGFLSQATGAHLFHKVGYTRNVIMHNYFLTELLKNSHTKQLVTYTYQLLTLCRYYSQCFTCINSLCLKCLKYVSLPFFPFPFSWPLPSWYPLRNDPNQKH